MLASRLFSARITRAVSRLFPALIGGALAVIAGTVSLRADVVTDWNTVMLQAGRTANTPPFVLTRIHAIVQTAVFDAVNGVERRYQPVLVPAMAPAGASLRAAAIEAASTTLTALFAPQASTFAAQRTTSLTALAATESAAAIAAGASWGQTVANAVLQARASDGFGVTTAPYLGGTAPGQWRPTAPGFAPGTFTDFASMKPWVIASTDAYLLPPPFALGSPEYARDYNETKMLGALASPQRTAEQSSIARFWGTLPPSYAWNSLAVTLALQQKLTVVENAKLLAALNLALADSTIACFYAKYRYGFWRPETAIAQAEFDGNTATAPEAGWAPFLVTPAFPEHASNHSVTSGAAAAVLARQFGETTTFTVSSYALPGVLRTFTTFSAAIDEIGDARVFGGMHFRNACNVGRVIGLAVADEVMARALQPLPNVGSVSARGYVGEGEQALIVGLIVSGQEPRRYVIRGVGPALSALGVSQPLANPRVRIYHGSTLISENDDWSDAELATPSARAGLFPLVAGSKDAALIATLAPGAHTIVITGDPGQRGVALAEAYPMP